MKVSHLPSSCGALLVTFRHERRFNLSKLSISLSTTHTHKQTHTHKHTHTCLIKQESLVPGRNHTHIRTHAHELVIVSRTCTHTHTHTHTHTQAMSIMTRKPLPSTILFSLLLLFHPSLLSLFSPFLSLSLTWPAVCAIAIPVGFFSFPSSFPSSPMLLLPLPCSS